MLLHKPLIAALLLLLFTGCGDNQALSSEEKEPAFQQEGKASYYGPGFHGKTTASGETFDQNELVAAHPELPFDTVVEVTNLNNDEKVEVRINDRGPFKPGRIIDLSKEAARQIDSIDDGVVPVQIEVIE
ncbi:septal ring lytic transglycosylase RlpA family protein [Stutzerimonas tarimensis]|uniref:Endolytic peptidoglycan transglycosylase RlpA n=1 Tax=Stutzerimonas tarimensis TaxID=1507735 RepID=A0ABV7T3X4_9GAMM